MRLATHASMMLCIIIALVFAACDEPNYPKSGPSASVHGFARESGIDIKDRYIVVFKSTVTNPDGVTDELTRGSGARVHFRYRHALKGFYATLPEAALEVIRRDPNVKYVEPDGIVTENAIQYNPPSWGLDRIDQALLPLDNLYSYANDGTGVTVYVIDGGIRFDHQEFTGRVFSGYDFVDNDADASDCRGHGTHVAGIVGGTTVGVAKNVRLVSVRVTDCNGSGSIGQVIAGVDWVTVNRTGPSVANMSVGGSFNQALNDAVQNSIASGIVYTVAAMNAGTDACTWSPASVPAALTVGMTTVEDSMRYNSNYGTCVDLFAPGRSIYSSTITGPNTYGLMTGTSMAAPHVAGVAALYLSANPNASPAQVASAIVSGAIPGVLIGLGLGSPNLLLNNIMAGPPPSPPSVPSSLTATAVSALRIDLSWTDNATNESGFGIERSTNGGSPWSILATVGPNATTWSSTGLSPNTPYWYRVRAFNSGGNSAYSNIATATTMTPQQMHIGGLSASSTSQGGKWTGYATITVHDGNHQPVSGVTVTIAWSNGASGTGTAVTNSTGQCVISKSGVKTNVSSIRATVTNLVGTGYSYNGSGNDVQHFIVIAKP